MYAGSCIRAHVERSAVTWDNDRSADRHGEPSQQGSSAGGQFAPRASDASFLVLIDGACATPICRHRLSTVLVLTALVVGTLALADLGVAERLPERLSTARWVSSLLAIGAACTETKAISR